MTTTTWTFAPAGVLGQGIADARPYPGVVVCPTPEAVRGTGLRAVGSVVDVPAAHSARLRSLNESVAVLARTDAPATPLSTDQQFTQIDGTTLGIHSPGRPQS